MIQRIVTVVRGNLIAWLALFIALGGTSLAASHYVINSTKQISPSLLKKLQGRVGKTGPQGAQGAIGPQGPKGAMGLNGSEGAQGAIGPSDGIVHYVTGPVALLANTQTTVSTLPIPGAGSYIIWAKAYFSATAGADTAVCTLNAEGDFDESQALAADTVAPQALALNVAHVYPAAGTANVKCTASAGGPQLLEAHFITMSAIKVGRLSRTDG